mmetsp:Transcript_20979/g.30814  ORF Transcript_20979/g.30814 Transcript_20979/m.30814 type:complete len:203 (+) Transcript_20979:185-793(+)|eukprot:CAMPEP_0195509506 /NCGR_PEP_ID=MMETSP0794_2-20130614/2429_1 /TAXON_ID=515487 /ORGANISM="Stephanopyxis turris, Strain CCMP 815" /LENGTH=202 /DNA_ID=CAMNT_0040636741 /DNA_START=183 /DNA_END=791 /DNA_ORIENTATION=-
MVSVYLVIAVQSCLLFFLQFGERFLPSNFLARKLCHAGSGLLMLYLDAKEVIARVFVYSVIIISLGITWKLFPTWVPSFRFGEDYDSGITIYLIIVCAWFFFQQPPIALAPLFFADPAGAVVGKFFTRQGMNKLWWANKTVAGSAAVFVFAFLSLSVDDIPDRLGIAAVCALAEAFGGKTYDNAFIAVPALGSWIYFHGWVA